MTVPTHTTAQLCAKHTAMDTEFRRLAINDPAADVLADEILDLEDQIMDGEITSVADIAAKLNIPCRPTDIPASERFTSGQRAACGFDRSPALAIRLSPYVIQRWRRIALRTFGGIDGSESGPRTSGVAGSTALRPVPQCRVVIDRGYGGVANAANRPAFHDGKAWDVRMRLDVKLGRYRSTLDQAAKADG